MTEQLTPYTNYQLSAIGVGVIAVGLADIRQCIDIILRTVPGSDPLRPLFGCGIYKYIDAPVNIAVPNMKLEIFEALNIWEPRINVTAVTHEIVNENIIFSISYQVVDSDAVDTLLWSTFNGIESNLSSGIILSALIPTKITGQHYNIDFLVDGNVAFPVSPKFGFNTRQQLLDWVNANWFNYGKWYLTIDKLVLYVAPGIAKIATLSITQTTYLYERIAVPVLTEGAFYNLSMILEGISVLPDFPLNLISNVDDLLLWVRANWGAYGDFSIETESVIRFDDFNDDFNDDFEHGGIDYYKFIVFETNLFTTASLTFI